jgi:hypothetical protein
LCLHKLFFPTLTLSTSFFRSPMFLNTLSLYLKEKEENFDNFDSSKQLIHANLTGSDRLKKKKENHLLFNWVLRRVIRQRIKLCQNRPIALLTYGTLIGPGGGPAPKCTSYVYMKLANKELDCNLPLEQSKNDAKLLIRSLCNWDQ